MVRKLINLLNFVIFLIIEFFIDLKKIKTNPHTLLIVRLDAIGDYILFRNFIEIIKKSERFKDYKITLCGNILWRDLAETFDKEYVDELIFIDRKKFYSNLFYKYSILKQIHKKGFEIAIEAEYSREILFGDEIIKVSNMKERIGSKGSLDKHSKWKRNLFTDKYYTKLINTDKNNLFEFYRNKEFFEKLLAQKIELKKPAIDTDKLIPAENLPKEYVVIFPGASNQKKMWDINNYIEVIQHIINSYNYYIIITGSPNEEYLAEKIISKINESRLLNFVSKTSLTQLAKIISESKLLISNETMAVHIAAAVNKKFICITNGERFERFLPYPKEIFDKAYYAYPDNFLKKIDTDENLKRQLWFDSNFDINTVKPQQVIDLLDKVIN
jgi:ADP-heptose:LPS heptosyltransferase